MLTDNDEMLFGKIHYGKLLKFVPSSYLLFIRYAMHDNMFNHSLIIYIDDRLKKENYGK